MDKIIQYVKKNYRTLIPVMVVLVLLVTIYFLYREYKYDNYRNKQEVDVYQYFGGVKNEYKAIVTYNLDDKIVDITSKDKSVEYDSTPVYYKDKKQVLFPSEMNIVFPLKEGSQFKTYKYMMYENNDGVHKLNINNQISEYDYFFLYDGQGLFFLPDNAEVFINNKKLRDISAMSYIKIDSGYTLIYYDYDKDESEVINIEGKIVTVKSGNIDINLSERSFDAFGKKILLSSPDKLNSVTKSN